MQSCVRAAITNIKGGVAGVLIYLSVTALVYGVAFMAALGNDTPGARLVLEWAGAYFLVAYPLWTIPIAYFLGGCFLFRDTLS
ncbi:MAG TPA: hypothetical protein PLN56_08175 [Methanoregulaceae archaeon]|nr:MAG: hypothetical protein IPI71_04490 [Methanolinea sp.]HON82035.1 hypothetical protein [Methanoregulaceae archaeon]HPD10959.1 hypothetical protein [Methanoregulaceae archaeon]HRT15911.1 hypothetical protein [Methanoregulaceae archaeon]HRU31376.1 hypothetical protein [Methanoregulaceae archaeon]